MMSAIYAERYLCSVDYAVHTEGHLRCAILPNVI